MNQDNPFQDIGIGAKDFPPNFDPTLIDEDKIPDIAIIRVKDKMFRQFFLKDANFRSQDFMIADPMDGYHKLKEDQITFAKWDPVRQASDNLDTVNVQKAYPGQMVRLAKLRSREIKAMVMSLLAQVYLIPAGTPKQ